jgi:cell division inhibitor SulA
MRKLMGTAPRHPGLWLDTPGHTSSSSQAIASLRSSTQGATELGQLCAQLAILSQQGQWIVLINPPHKAYKQQLAQAGVRMDRILLVHAKDEVETLWAMEKALTSGTSSAVITWTRQLDERDNRRLQIVAKSARAMGVIIEDVNAHLQQSMILNAQMPLKATGHLSAFH